MFTVTEEPKELNTTKGKVLVIRFALGTDQAKGFIIKHDGIAAICINTSFPENIQKCVFCHELLHYKLGHFDRLEAAEDPGEKERLKEVFELELDQYGCGPNVQYSPELAAVGL